MGYEKASSQEPHRYCLVAVHILRSAPILIVKAMPNFSYAAYNRSESSRK